MIQSLEMLTTYLSLPFVQYALIVGVLVALSAGLLGVPLVLKRYSFIGDGLSHVGFGALAVATLLDIAAPLTVVLPITVVAAVLLLSAKENARLKGDAAIAVISVSALALGYLLLHLSSSSVNVAGDVCSSLFGSTSLLTLRKSDVLLCAVMAAAILLFFILFYHRIFAVSFDEVFLAAVGVRARLYNLLIAVATAVVIAIAMQLVGSLLISALIIFPALSSMRRFHTFRAVVISSAVLSVVGALVGMLLSILCSTPVGATIVVTDLVIYLLFSLPDLFRRA